MKTISELLGDTQQVFTFFRDYEKYFYEEPTKEHILLINVLKVIESNKILTRVYTEGKGCPLKNRKYIYRAFIAKSILGIQTVDKLINRLIADRNLKRICGYNYEDDIPSESTFSRAFAEFSIDNLGQKNHDYIINEHLKDKIIGHISRDATAINSREKPMNKKKDVKPKSKRKRGRPAKGEVTEQKEATVLEKQLKLTANEAIKELNQKAAWGCKLNSHGNRHAWKGYKLHLDVSDMGIPISVVLTGANVHDSQVALPLEKITASKCVFLYSVMDAAYDAEIIHEYIKGQGRVPIIDENKRKGNKIGFDPAKKERFKIRSVAERCNSHLKDWLFGTAIYVKGDKKVFQYLMFGILVLTAIKILQYLI